MATKNAKRKTKSAALPKALAKRAAALSTQKRRRLLTQAKELIALIKRRRAEISDAFYDIGEALVVLQQRDMLSALGMKSFAELCESKLGISVSLAAQLVDVVKSMTREEAVAMGQSKAIAMVALAQATPAPDTPGELFAKGRVRVPGAPDIDARTAGARRIATAAKQFRDASDKGAPRRGRTTTAEERAYAAKLQAAVRRAGLDRATVEVVATKPGQISDVRIAHVAVDRIGDLAKALASVRIHRRA